MKKQIRRDIVTGISITLGLLLGAEIILRVYAKLKWSPVLSWEWQIVDSELVARLKPGFKSEALKINSLGFRGEEISIEKPKNIFRIVVMGDSVPFGFLSKNSFPEELQNILNFRKPRGSPWHFEVVNTGVPGYTSWQVLKMFKKDVISLKPDLLLIYVGLNDIWSHNPFNPKSKATDFINTICRKVYIVKFMFKLLEHSQTSLFLRKDFEERKRMLESFYPAYFAENLRNIVKEAKKINCKVVFLTLPTTLHLKNNPKKKIQFPSLGSNPELYLLLWSRYDHALKEISTQEKIYLIDLVKELRKIPEASKLFMDDTHFNEKGNRTIAEVIYKNLLGFGLF